MMRSNDMWKSGKIYGCESDAESAAGAAVGTTLGPLRAWDATSLVCPLLLLLLLTVGGRRDDARSRLAAVALGLIRLGVSQIDAGRQVCLLWLLRRGRRSKREEFLFETNGAGGRSFRQPHAGGERAAWLAVDPEDFEVAFSIRTRAIDGDAFGWIVAVDEGDAVSIADGGDADERIIVKWIHIRCGIGRGDDGAGCEGRVDPQTAVFAQRCLARQFGIGGCVKDGNQCEEGRDTRDEPRCRRPRANPLTGSGGGES